MSEQPFEDIRILEQVLTLLKTLDPEEQQRILGLINQYFSHHANESTYRNVVANARAAESEHARSSIGDFSRDRTITAKDFLLQKKPQADIEKVACLAYYLTHYLNMTEFQTRDISLANTEAAQKKFSNPSLSLYNAVKAGYIISPSKNFWRLSAIGEVFVQALPDRDAAKSAVAEAKPSRKTRKSKSKRAKSPKVSK